MSNDITVALTVLGIILYIVAIITIIVYADSACCKGKTHEFDIYEEIP